MLIPEAGKQDRQWLHSSRKENGPKRKEVVMNIKQTRFKSREFLSHLRRRKVVFRENRKHVWSENEIRSFHSYSCGLWKRGSKGTKEAGKNRTERKTK